MLVPVIWLRELVSFSIDVDELAERLTLAGIEVDNVHRAGASDPLVVSGRVVACVEDVSRPGLHIVTVSIGAGGHITTITRAPNSNCRSDRPQSAGSPGRRHDLFRR